MRNKQNEKIFASFCDGYSAALRDLEIEEDAITCWETIIHQSGCDYVAYVNRDKLGVH